jgi:two-component system, cell cycle response regulator DivK
MTKILIVDDNLDNQEILARRLQLAGNFQIAVASNGKQALEIAAVIKPDLILMDLRMPVMDGYEATRALKQTEWGKNIPVVAITAYASREHMHKALNAGCCDFIAKPILDYALMGRKIRALLGMEEPQRAPHHFQAA